MQRYEHTCISRDLPFSTNNAHYTISLGICKFSSQSESAEVLIVIIVNG